VTDHVALDGSVGELRIGVSGWRYPNWRGRFYPKGLPQRAELAYAAERFGSIEINSSFYGLQRPETYRRWTRETRDDFVFAVKGSRFITHLKKLRDVDTALANFFASGVLALQAKLGPILWQLPPTMTFDEETLTKFLSQLPRSSAEAAVLAGHHDARLTGRSWTDAGADRSLRHCLEVRHESFRTARVYELLRHHDVGLVVADSAGRFPMILQTTTEFVYVRLHGADELYISGYDAAALREWASRIDGWQASGRDVYVYFDNDAKVHAPFDAIALEKLCGQLRPPVDADHAVGDPTQHPLPSNE
jgi:uncharacterized protein YecE (DUF72 family)